MVIGRRKKRKITGLQQKIRKLEKENEKFKESAGNASHESFNIQHPDNLNKIIELNRIGIFILNHNELSFSLIAQNIFGIVQNDPLPIQDFKSIILPEDRSIFEKALDEVQKSGKLSEIELKIARSEGETREFRLVYIHLTGLSDSHNQETDHYTILASVKDITKQDKIKRDLIKSRDKAEESQRLKNIFLSNLSREIRTPMNSIIGFSELLNIGNLPYEKRHAYVKTIKEQGIHLLRMIDDLVELTKLESGKISIKKAPCNIDLLLNELLNVFNQYKNIQHKEHLNISVVYPEHKGVILYSDPGRLQQLISNLISNSVKYTQKGNIEIGYRLTDEAKVLFYVKDTGIGISQELQKRIFGKFTEENKTLTKIEDSGLGLTLSKNFIQLLGGKIWVESELGKGSTFYFTLPYEEVPEEYQDMIQEEESDIPSYTWKDKVILIVEDDEVNYKFLEAVLQETGVQVLHAYNGLQAIELCKTIPKIDVVLMDIKMPGMDGFETTERIRQFNKELPVIAQTAFVSVDEINQCINAGCNDHISKPIEIKTFLEKVDKYLKF